MEGDYAYSFEDWKQGEGRALHGDYQEVLLALRNCKARLKTTVALVNEQKYLIDELQNDVEKSEETEAPLDRKLSLRELELAKKSYRDAFQELQLCKKQMKETQSLKEKSLTFLIQSFEQSRMSEGFGEMEAGLEPV